jgi:hypothetical protein
LLFSFCEGEGDCTKESPGGQFNIFGATEEKEVCGLWEGMRVKKNLSERGHGAWSKRFWSGRAGSGKLFGQRRSGCAQGLHRKCRKRVVRGRMRK